jgi:YesN/AraC family two-component response regulator
VAADGTAALALMEEMTPSLVILDLMMPEMDGFDVLDWIRAEDRTRRVPVVILSTRMLNLDDLRRIEQHASVTFQTKGILSREEMTASIHSALLGIETLPQYSSALVKRAVVYFHQNYHRSLSRWELAEAIGVSEDHLSRVFRREIGISPWEYLSRYRILRAKELLRCTNDSIRAVAHRVGFTDPAYFSRVFRKVTDFSPSSYRKYAE